MESTKTLYLCSGLEQAGSNLVSRFFLRRGDMTGVLDVPSDRLLGVSPLPAQSRLWLGTTLTAFRPTELVQHYRDDGWQVCPLLVIRDVRRVWAEWLVTGVGPGGQTAQDPPLRMRMRRLLEDWELFYWFDWPIVRYEDLASDAPVALRAICKRFELEWDEAMVRDFVPPAAAVGPLAVADADLAWLEGLFRDFFRENDYPEHLAEHAADAPALRMKAA